MKSKYLILFIIFLCLNIFSFSNETYTDNYLRNSFNKRLPSLNPALIMDADARTFNIGFTGLSSDSGKILEVVKTKPIGLYYASLYIGSRIGYFNLVDKEKYQDKHLIVIGGALNPFKQLNFGINLNYIYDVKAPYNKHHGTLDLGLSYNYLRHQLLGVHTLGVSLQNALSFGSGSIQSFTQPSAMDFMWRINLLENRFENVTNVTLNNLYYSEKYKVQPKTKANIYSDFKFRFKPIETSFGIGNNVLGASAGFRIFRNGMFNFNTGFKFHHYWDNVNINSYSGYFNFELDKDREEWYSYRMSPCGCGIGNLYNSMRKLYVDRDYYNSLFLCSRLFVEYPDFFKNDWVLLFIIKNLYNLELKNLILEYKKRFIEKFKKSATSTYWRYEEMLSFSNRNISDSLIISFNNLKKNSGLYVNGNNKRKKHIREKDHYIDSIVNEAYLLMAESRIKNNDINSAIIYLDSITEKSPIWLYANMKKYMIQGINDEKILDRIVKKISAINDSTYNGDINTIYDFAFNAIYNGHIDPCKLENLFYSASPLNKNKTDKWYGYALCKFKNEEWDKCLIECINVINFKGRAQLNARLLKVKCLEKLGKPDSALNEIKDLDSLIVLTKENEILEKNELISNYPDIMKKQDSLGIKVDSLMNSSQSSFIVMQIDSLEPILEENVSKIKRYNELVRDAYKKKYDPFNLDVLHEDVKKKIKKLEAAVIKKEEPIESISSPQDLDDK